LPSSGIVAAQMNIDITSKHHSKTHKITEVAINIAAKLNVYFSQHTPEKKHK